MKSFRALALATVFAATLWSCTPASAQWQTTTHSVPIGKGSGVTGFNKASPGTTGLPLVSNGPSADPSFQAAIIAGNGITPTGTNPTVFAASYPWLDVGTFGAIGDGTTNNNTALQNAWTAAANGGNIRFPCGIFKITAQLTVTVAEAKNVTVQGSGADCTVLFVSGAAGPAFTYGGFDSSVAVKDMSIVTDGGGTQTGLTLNQPSAGASPTQNIVTNAVSNVVMRGDDASSIPNVHYWGTAVSETGVVNLALRDLAIRGRTSTGSNAFGIGVAVAGAGVNKYSTGISLVNVTANYVDTGLTVGDYVQGIAVTNYNVRSNAGISIPAGPGVEDTILQVTNSQFDVNACGICIADTMFTGLQLSNSSLVMEQFGIGVSFAGTAQFAITGNVFRGNTTSSTVGISFAGAFGQGGTVSGNNFVGLGVGVGFGPGVNPNALVTNNQMASNTADYSIGSGGGTIIVDTVPRLFAGLPACTAQTRYSQFLVADPSATPTYRSIVSTGGGSLAPTPILCNGTGWEAH